MHLNYSGLVGVVRNYSVHFHKAAQASVLLECLVLLEVSSLSFSDQWVECHLPTSDTFVFSCSPVLSLQCWHNCYCDPLEQANCKPKCSSLLHLATPLTGNCQAMISYFRLRSHHPFTLLSLLMYCSSRKIVNTSVGKITHFTAASLTCRQQ